MRQVKVSFIDEAADEWEELTKKVSEEISKGIPNSKDQQLLKAIKHKVERIKLNPQCGHSVDKEDIPKKYPVDNLWVVELIGYWRMLYTLRGSQVEILCFILEIFDHDEYNDLFGYKKR